MDVQVMWWCLDRKYFGPTAVSRGERRAPHGQGMGSRYEAQAQAWGAVPEEQRRELDSLQPLLS